MKQGLQQRRLFFCINPRAGGGKALAWWQHALPILEQQQLNFFWQYSGGGTKTQQHVRRAVLHSKANTVVAIGGDGHLHDVLNGLVQQDKLITPKLALALYPAGSGCDFARMVYANHGHTTIDDLLNLLAYGQEKLIDIGRADFWANNGQSSSAYFLNAGDIGLGAQTCLCINAKGGLLKEVVPHGKLAFLLAALQALMVYDYPHIIVEADGELLNGNYLLAGAGNGRYMGGKMLLFPKARLDDGLLDLLLVEGFSRFKAFLLLNRAYDGSILRLRGTQYRQVKTIILTPKPPHTLELDGELPGLAPVKLQVLPKLLPLLFWDKNIDK